MIPFWLRRHALLLRNLLANREQPDLGALSRIDEAEDFVWAILPHAARTFSACIALMPRRSALPSAVAYLYCRMLDTYEDLVPSQTSRESALRSFAARLTTSGNSLGAAPSVESPTIIDDRDRAHLLLVERAALVDRVFATFDAPTREIIRDLVRDMAEGMCWSSAAFDAQSGVLVSEEQLATYCRHVLGNPTVFGIRILRLHYGQPVTLSDAEREDAMLVGEFVQLANVTRDIEKDLRRGIAYDPALKGDLGVNVERAAAGQPESATSTRVRAVRARMLRMALARSGAYTRAINSIRLPSVSVARAAAVLMLLFTERYYRSCAQRAGLPAWNGPDSTLALLMRSIPTAFSAQLGRSEMLRAERHLLAALSS